MRLRAGTLGYPREWKGAPRPPPRNQRLVQRATTRLWRFQGDAPQRTSESALPRCFSGRSSGILGPPPLQRATRRSKAENFGAHGGADVLASEAEIFGALYGGTRDSGDD